MPPQQPKPPDLDEQGNPVSNTPPPDLDAYGYPIQQAPASMWDNPVWKALTQPPEFVTKGVNKFADWITTPELENETIWLGGIPVGENLVKGFIGGAAQGASQFINPVDVAGLATGVGEYNAARRGASTLAKALKWGERATSAPVALHGFERVTDPTSSLGEKAAGIAELAGGAYGAFGPPTPVRPRPGASALDTGPTRPPAGPPTGPPPPPPVATRQGTLPFAEPQIRSRPPSVEGQGILPLDYDQPIPPIRPPIRPEVAEAVTAPPPPPETMLDVTGKGGLEADLTTMEGIQKAYAEGKIDRETALRNAAKVHRKLLKKPEPEARVQDTIKATVDEEEVIIDPETGEIISDKPYPLTTEPTAGTPAPAGVDEVMQLMLTKQVKNIAELQRKLQVSFTKTKELWEAAKEKGKLIKGADGYYEAPEIPIGAQKSAGEAVLPTPFREQLKALYYTDEEISKMSTDEAWNIIKSDASFNQADWMERFSPEGEGTFIGKEPPSVSIPMTQPSKSTIVVKGGETELIKQLRKDGYKFVDIDSQGNIIMGRMEPSDVEAPGFQSKYKGATDEALTQGNQLDEEGNYIFKTAEPDSVNEPVFKTKEGFTIDELEEAVERRNAQVRELRIKAKSEPGNVGPIHQALEMAEKGAKTAGIRLSVARKEAANFKARGISDLLGEEGSKIESLPRTRDRGWSEDTSQSRMTLEEIEIWNEARGIKRYEEPEPDVPRVGWELEREFAGPFKKPEPRIENDVLRGLIEREGSQMAVSEEGLAGMGIPDTPEARRDMIEIFRGTISGETPHIAGKELVQNAIDAATAHPAGKGKVNVSYDELNRQIVVQDNGPGMTRRELQTDYLDLTGSGKRGGEVRTIGELGVGKIAYLTKGEKVSVVTINRDPNTGQLMKHSFDATPDEVLDMKVNVRSEPAPQGSKTGTTVRLFLEDKERWWGLRQFLRDLEKHSQLSVPVETLEQHGGANVNKYGGPTSPVIIAPKTSAVGQFSAGGVRKVLGETTSPGAKLKVSIPWDAMEIETDSIDAILVSRGMFQGIHKMGIGPGKKRVPDKILVEIDPTVKGTHKDYPLTTPTRENMKWETANKVQEIIDDKIINEAAKKRNEELETIFRQIVPKKGERFAMVDPGERFTPDELKMIATNPEMIKIAQVADTFLREIESELGHMIYGKKIYSTGFILEEQTRGINVRNPNNHDEFTILINPIGILGDNSTPRSAADAIVHAMVHEFTHIIERSEGKHFTSALYSVYSNLDMRKQYNVRTRLEKILEARAAGGKFGPEIQELLRKGEIASGRPGRERLALIAEEGSQLPAPKRRTGTSGTGETTGSNTLRNIPVGRSIVVNPKNASPEVVKKLWEEGFRFDGETQNGSIKFTKKAEPGAGPILEEEVGGRRPTTRALRGQLGAIQDAQKSNAVMEAFNFPRGVMASADLSAPLRQGLPLIHKKEFWTSMAPMMRSWATEEGFQASQAAIASRPLFKKRVDALGKEMPSFADDAGLKLTDLTDLTSREEAIMSTWAETGGYVEGKSRGIPGISKAYSQTLGKVVRKSNRAYTAFLNNLRADTFEALVKDAGIFTGDPRQIERNLPLARSIADFVNTATGRGKLAVDIPKSMQGAFGGKTELSLESSATLLNTTLFAPRLIASRVRMLNPVTYMMAPPQVRKEYVKSLLALTAFGSTVLSLAKMAGADVSFDPTNSDFLKAKIGDKVRIDPWAGFQQYAVLFSRLASGKVTSSTSGKEYNLWEKKGPFDPTHADIMSRFVRGKTNPVFNFAWGIADAQREMSGRKMKFGTPNPFENSITQRFIPIFVQDVYQIAQESPELLPFLAPAAGLGMGVQVYDNPRSGFYGDDSTGGEMSEMKSLW